MALAGFLIERSAVRAQGFRYNQGYRSELRDLFMHTLRSTIRIVRPIVVCLLAALILAGQVAVSTAQSTDALPDPDGVTFALVADGFIRPLFVTHAGDGSGRLFVVEQGGRIWILDRSGQCLPVPFLDISSLVSPAANQLDTYTERGLLGLAFHPDYAQNGYFYVNYTDLSGTTHITRYSVSATDPNAADPASAQTLLTQSQPFPNHNGGWLGFGPDGYLYISLGDGGAAGDPLGAGQMLNTWLGKMLRIDVNTDDGRPYAIPPDNPFVGQANALPEIWAYGLRNAWRSSFDRLTGDFYIADVGQNQWEEVNFQPASSRGGENYGWRAYEGTHVYDANMRVSGAVQPFAEYSHSEGISVTGGYVYRGQRLPNLYGVYFFGDFGSGTLWAARRTADETWLVEPFVLRSGLTISSFGEDEAGELYIVDYRGAVYRFEPAP